MLSEFTDIPFSDADHAEQSLTALFARNRPELAPPLAKTLREVADPLQALIGLNRFLDASKSPDSEIGLMIERPAYLRQLAIIFCQSHFLTTILYKNPEYALWLWEEGRLDHARSREALLSEILREEDLLEDFDACCRTLRQFRKREILRIAARDLIAHAPVDSLTEDLSNLADAMLEAAIAAARRNLEARFGAPRCAEGPGKARESAFTVMAMGKLGGRELNFSSDIDLLFIYAEEGMTAGENVRSLSNAEYFGKLGELIIKAIAEQTGDGLIFRVDMRLRPHGRSGPLAVSLNTAIEYYAEYGRAWERQALIKARPAAGDAALGEAFIARLRPFVFPKYFDDETLEDIRQTKQQLEAMVAARGDSDREVKLGRGGIRDIEFTVQILQLLNGGNAPELRTTNTLEAIAELGRHDFLRPLDAETLSSNYVFLRKAEHRLQIEGGRQRHTLPGAPKALDDFARRMGYANGEAFMNAYRDRAVETRRILELFMAKEGAGELWIGDLLNPHSEGGAGLKKLEELGFQKPVQSRAELLQLAIGAGTRPYSVHVRHQFQEIAPFVIRALSQTSRPDATLLRLGQILARLSAPAGLYEMLKWSPILCHYLVTLVSNSEYLCNILLRDPGLLDILSSASALDTAATRESLAEDLARLEGAVNPEAALYRMRDGEMLRIAMRELVRHITVAQVGDELTLLAEGVLERALKEAREKIAQRHGPLDIPMAVLGLGKLGGWEMGYGSDMDVLFVYEAGHKTSAPVSPAEYFAAVASHTLKRLKEPTRHGVLYDVDIRLRPDGNKGPLAVNHERLESYYLHEGQPWERLALMKVRAVAGDPEFARRVEKIAKDAAFSLPLDFSSLEHIESLRKQLIAKASKFDIKKSRGGVSEIEITVRYWQLRHVEKHPSLKRGDVLGALDILAGEKLVSPEDCETLRKAYTRLRKILNRVRMMDGGGGTELPAGPAARAELAARLGIKQDLLDYVNDHKAKVGLIYQRTFNEALEKT